jgi:hypothetical protein
MSERPYLRDCPFCHADGSNDEIIAFMSLTDVVHQFDYGYTIRCVQCGAEVNDEYKDTVVHLWNGTSPEDDDDASQSREERT